MQIGAAQRGSALYRMSLRDRRPANGISRHNSISEPPRADAPGLLAASCAEVMGATAAVLMVREQGEEPDLLGSFGPFAMPVPQPPFMLADSARASDPRLARTSAHGRNWLHIEVPLAEGGRLTLSLSFVEHQAAQQAEERIDLAWPALLAFAAALDAGKDARCSVASYEAALNRSELGILLLRADGSLLFANRTAEAVLDKGDFLRRSGGSIAARDVSDAVKLQVAIEHVCRETGSDGEDPVVALRRKGKRPLLVCISPAADAAGGEAGAVLRIIDPDRDSIPRIEPVCAHYRLSPVETRLACLLATGASMEDAAKILRIKEQTARSYLKHIFLKTDTNRQTALMQLLLSSSVRALPAGRFRIL